MSMYLRGLVLLLLSVVVLHYLFLRSTNLLIVTQTIAKRFWFCCVAYCKMQNCVSFISIQRFQRSHAS